MELGNRFSSKIISVLTGTQQQQQITWPELYQQIEFHSLTLDILLSYLLPSYLFEARKKETNKNKANQRTQNNIISFKKLNTHTQDKKCVCLNGIPATNEHVSLLFCWHMEFHLHRF